jgi:hypothetical protein
MEEYYNLFRMFLDGKSINNICNYQWVLLLSVAGFIC